MPPARRERSIFRCPIISPASDPLPPSLEPTFALVALPNNNLFQEFMRTCIKRVRDQVPVTLSAKARKEALDRSLKPQNLDLYYGQLHMKCYNCYQQYKDHFEIVNH